MAIAEWKYPFPSRTRKSSALTPMVLRRRGRVGSRQALFFCPPRIMRAWLRLPLRRRAPSTAAASAPRPASQHASDGAPSLGQGFLRRDLPASCAPCRSSCPSEPPGALSAFWRKLGMRTVLCPFFLKNGKCGHPLRPVPVQRRTASWNPLDL